MFIQFPHIFISRLKKKDILRGVHCHFSHCLPEALVTTPVRVVVLYISDYFCCFFEGHSSFLASLVEKIFGFSNFELKFAE